MASKNVPPRKKENLPDDEAEILRKEVWHLLVDLNLTTSGNIIKLAAILSQLMNTTISRTTLNMALTGYRRTAP